MSTLTATTASLIEERVPWLDAEMEACLASASRDLDLYRWAGYHLGWRDAELREMSPADRRKHGGKRLRGVLAILTCEAVGGDGKASAAAGAAVELVHNFSLVHDDIEDNDAERRHRPTVWKLWGVPHAINAGSNLQAMVDMALLRLADRYPAERVIECLRVLNHAVVLMTEGQFLDMSAEDAAEVSLENYLRMIGGKTAALIAAALRLGALLGSEDEARVTAMAEFGHGFGLAFQCQDDFLGMWGEPAVTGKPVGSDLLQGKRSLPIVHALEAAPAGSAGGAALRLALAARDVPATLDLLECLGTRTWVREQVEEHTARALAALERARPGEPYAEAIRNITWYALGRDS